MRRLVGAIGAIISAVSAFGQSEYSLRYGVDDSRDGKSELALRKRGPNFTVESVSPNGAGSVLALYTPKYTSVEIRKPGSDRTIDLYKPGKMVIPNLPLLPFDAGPLSITADDIRAGRVPNTDVLAGDGAAFDDADFRMDSSGALIEVDRMWQDRPYLIEKFAGIQTVAAGLDIPRRIVMRNVEKGCERTTVFTLIRASAMSSSRLDSGAVRIAAVTTGGSQRNGKRSVDRRDILGRALPASEGSPEGDPSVPILTIVAGLAAVSVVAFQRRRR